MLEKVNTKSKTMCFETPQKVFDAKYIKVQWKFGWETFDLRSLKLAQTKIKGAMLKTIEVKKRNGHDQKRKGSKEQDSQEEKNMKISPQKQRKAKEN